MTPTSRATFSRANTASPDDWLNTDDVTFRGNASSEEQVG
jgi:hypothetical protein